VEKSKQKTLPKAKAIFNLILLKQKIKTEAKIKTLAYWLCCFDFTSIAAAFGKLTLLRFGTLLKVCISR
jgi:hypothetical protein